MLAHAIPIAHSPGYGHGGDPSTIAAVREKVMKFVGEIHQAVDGSAAGYLSEGDRHGMSYTSL